jgi:hypothetical protein
MIFYYHCYRGAHLSIVAAALHLNKLNSHPGISDILGLEYFDKLQPQDMGVPVLAGYDTNGCPVYFLGLGPGSRIFTQFADSCTEKLGIGLNYKSIDCLQCLTLMVRLGGFISRYKRFKGIGRYLAAWGVQRNLPRLQSLVLHARDS